MTTMRKFHWFWAWDDEKEEAWLRKMSQQGWHFRAVTPPGSYLFEQGEPTDYVYRLDYFTDGRDRANYLQLFEDAGWSYLGDMGGWQYFRHPTVDDEPLEIYTDNASKAQKYRRIMAFLVIMLPVLLSTVILIGSGVQSLLLQIITVPLALALVMYAYAMVRLLMRIGQLQRQA